MKPFTPAKLPIDDIDWSALVSVIGRANRALARFDGILSAVPNPMVLLSPLTTQEAVFSSKIEGTQATLGDVLKFEAGEVPKEKAREYDIQEIINYRRAMAYAEAALQKKPFHLNLLLDLHKILLDSVRGRNKQPGVVRKEQNWIGPQGATIDEAFFVPPEHTLLPEYLGNWETYYHSDRPDPLVQLSFLHAQFEILHPFKDGNGRLGRIIIPLFIFEKQLLQWPMFYLSGYLERNRTQYIEALRALDNSTQAWTRWQLFFLSAIAEQAELNRKKAADILALYDRLKTELHARTPSQYSISILDAMFHQPIFGIGDLIKYDNMPSRPRLTGIINELSACGILKMIEPGGGRSPRIFALAELLNICEGAATF